MENLARQIKKLVESLQRLNQLITELIEKL